VAKNLASAAGSDYIGNGRDSGRMAFVIAPLPGIPPEQVEAVLEKAIADIGDKGITQDELDRAKSTLEARRVFESDNQMTLARRYGEAVALGRSIEDLDDVPRRIQAIGVNDIKRVAREYLVAARSVTGTLAPPTAGKTTTGTGSLATKQ
jgi:zinc protease